MVQNTPIGTQPARGLNGLRLDPSAQRELGYGDAGLTSLAVAESTQKLSPEDREDLLKRLEDQRAFFRHIEVD